jgi:hypothetical protein
LDNLKPQNRQASFQSVHRFSKPIGAISGTRGPTFTAMQKRDPTLVLYTPKYKKNFQNGVILIKGENHALYLFPQDHF